MSPTQPRVGDVFLHRRVQNQDGTQMEFRVTCIRYGWVYYRPLGGGHTQFCAVGDLERWALPPPEKKP